MVAAVGFEPTPLQKSLCQAPKRLQSLIMRINAYNVSFKYVPGNDLKIADALSRDFCDSVCDTKCHIFHVNNFTDMPDSQTDQIKHALAQDHEATALLKVINNGWPRMKSQLPAIVSEESLCVLSVYCKLYPVQKIPEDLGTYKHGGSVKKNPADIAITTEKS